MVYDLAVIGGGAAGFYGAIRFSEQLRGAKIIIVEKSPKLLSKVRVSGGGRCNVTHYEFEPKPLSKHYPRGEKFLRALFERHGPIDVIEWFKVKGVELKTEEDGRMFPTTDSSETIIGCFMREALAASIKISVGDGAVSVKQHDSEFLITLESDTSIQAKALLVATGGSPNARSYEFISNLGHTITPLLPSLFTFNDRSRRHADLMGVAVPSAEVRIEGTKLASRGPVLVTHWGLSGPAVIRLSAWAADHLAKVKYEFVALVNWVDGKKEEDLRQELTALKQTRPKQKIVTNTLFNIPLRLWQRLCEESEIENDRIWGEVSMRQLNKLIENLIRSRFEIKGKTTFKEEFVTCGGVSLEEVDNKTMQSKLIPGLYFAGEVLNVDGETGGFNFQAAWSSAYVAATSIAAMLAEKKRSPV